MRKERGERERLNGRKKEVPRKSEKEGARSGIFGKVLCNVRHGRINWLIVADCNMKQELPLEFLLSRNAPVKAENRANKAADEPKPDKSPARKRAAKKAV